MTETKCTCGREGEACPVCGEREIPVYWCDGCRRAVAEKRCPLCGLKARKTTRKKEKRAG
ncbi:MAG TPA: hypothetical protein VF775_03045 [Geobacteraceae bacterium]